MAEGTNVAERDAGTSGGVADASITAVVCCYTEDRWDQIVAAVDSLRSQTARPQRILIVVDHNEGLLARCQEAFRDADVIANRYRQGLSGGKNTALEAVTTDFVAFLDDDAVAESTWLEGLARHLEDPAVVGAGSRVDPAWEQPASWFPTEMAWTVGCSYRGLPEHATPIRNTFGGASIYRTSAVRRLDGFDTSLGRVAGSLGGGEETEFSIRLAAVTGGHLMFDPSVAISHHVPAERTRVPYVLRRCRDEGRSKAALAQRVETGEALGDEQSFLTQTVPKGVVRYLGEALRGDPAGVARAFVLVACVAAAGIGFLPEAIRQRRS